MNKGFIQVYTGNGKGKTTAAIGQAVRAAGYGLKSYILMLMKDFPYNEIKALHLLEKWITIVQIGKDDFVFKKESPPKDEIDNAKTAIEEFKKQMLSGNYDLLILDEIFASIYFGLAETELVIDLIKSKPDNVELILTGRYCPQEVIELADLVTEMKEIKHYYQKGILSRKGIDN